MLCEMVTLCVLLFEIQASTKMAEPPQLRRQAQMHKKTLWKHAIKPAGLIPLTQAMLKHTEPEPKPVI
jgi:hypothetical protein